MKMIIEKFKLPNHDDELDYFLSGGATLGMPAPSDGAAPFNIFPKKGFDAVDFGKVTIFCGSSNTEKNLLLRIISSKLGSINMPEGMSERCLPDYLDMCYVKYGNFDERRETQFMLITKEQSEGYIKKMYADLSRDQIWSVVSFYENIIEQGALYLLEEPDNGMSLSEQEEFAQMLVDFVKASGNQFVISTNSHVLLNIPEAVIYDFDERVIRPSVWHRSDVAQRHINYLETVKKEHHSKSKRST